MEASPDDIETVLPAFGFFLSWIGVIWTLGLMASRVNKKLPPGEDRFSVIVVKQREFKLIGLHRRLFPHSWLPQLVLLFTVILVWCALKLAR